MKKWLENFWYHYKWVTIISVFFIIVAAICISQLITRESYDVYIRYVGNADISGTQYNDMVASFEKIHVDKNKDGKNTVNFARVGYITDSENKYQNDVNAGAREILSSMLVQPYYIYIMDTGAYESYKESGIFIPLSQAFPDEDFSDVSYDSYAVYFSKTEFCKNSPSMEWVTDDMVMVLKIVPYDSVITGKKSKAELESFDIHSEVFKTIVFG